MAKEVVDDLNHRLAVSIPPGGFGENILVEGIGNLSNLAPGDLILLGNGILVEVTEQNAPCANLKIWHKLLPKESMGRHGIVGIVKKGGVLRP